MSTREIRDNVINFLYSDYAMYAFYLMFAIVISLIIFSLLSVFKNFSTKKKKYKRLLNVETDRIARELNIENPAIKTRSNGVEKKENLIVKTFKEYAFYGGKPKTLILVGIIGYLVTSIIIYALAQDIILGFMLGFVWFTILYVFIDGKCSKARKNFIKGFGQALRTLSASVGSSNSFEGGVRTIIEREGINEKVREEFTIINNDLINNKSREEVMEEFWQRNSSIPEFAMFAIVMQFFSKTGGSGLAKILSQLEGSLNTRVMNYAKVDAELGVNKTLMNFFVYGYILALVLVPFFYPTFYTALTDAGLMGYGKALMSVLMHMISVVLYKGLIRKCSEGA